MHKCMHCHTYTGAIAASAPLIAFHGLASYIDPSKYWSIVTRDFTPSAGCDTQCSVFMQVCFCMRALYQVHRVFVYVITYTYMYLYVGVQLQETIHLVQDVTRNVQASCRYVCVCVCYTNAYKHIHMHIMCLYVITYTYMYVYVGVQLQETTHLVQDVTRNVQA
jgi:hypothetical protein